MSEEKQKDNGKDSENNEEGIIRRPESGPIFGRYNTFIWLLTKVFAGGLFLFLTNGALPLWATVLITLILFCFFAYNEFVKHRNKLSKPQYWVGLIVTLAFFIGLGYQVLSIDMSETDLPLTDAQEAQRARLNPVCDPRVDLFPKEGYVVVRWNIENIGDTPALNVRMVVLFHLPLVPSDSLPTYALPSGTYPGTQAVSIGAHKTYIRGARWSPPYPEMTVSDFQHANMSLNTAIKVEYEDVFHKTHRAYGNVMIWNNAFGVMTLPTPPSD